MINNNDDIKNTINKILYIKLDDISPNPFQPRTLFDDSKLSTLADSINRYGVLQPIIVNKKQKENGDDYFEIIAGERRYRAAKMAGLTEIPAVIKKKKISEREKFELAIIENLQREDLNPIDRSKAFLRLAEEFSLTHNQIAERLGKSREYISNSIRILSLCDDALDALKYKKISEGHARSLLLLKNRILEQKELLNKIIKNKLTIRSAEKIAKKFLFNKKNNYSHLSDTENNIFDKKKMLENRFSEKLGTKVQIDSTNNGGGKLTIEYFSEEDLEKILSLIEEKEIKKQDSFINFINKKKEGEPEKESDETINNINSNITQEDSNFIDTKYNIDFDAFEEKEKEKENLVILDNSINVENEKKEEKKDEKINNWNLNNENKNNKPTEKKDNLIYNPNNSKQRDLSLDNNSLNSAEDEEKDEKINNDLNLDYEKKNNEILSIEKKSLTSALEETEKKLNDYQAKEAPPFIPNSIDISKENETSKIDINTKNTETKANQNSPIYEEFLMKKEYKKEIKEEEELFSDFTINTMAEFGKKKYTKNNQNNFIDEENSKKVLKNLTNEVFFNDQKEKVKEKEEEKESDILHNNNKNPAKAKMVNIAIGSDFIRQPQNNNNNDNKEKQSIKNNLYENIQSQETTENNSPILSKENFSEEEKQDNNPLNKLFFR